MPGDNILLEIRADIKDVKAKLKQINSDFKGASKNVEAQTQRMNSGFSNLKRIIAGAFSVAVVYKFIQGMEGCVRAASNLEEQTAKFGTVFRGSMDKANESVEKLTESYGMSTREARQHMAAIQDLLVPMGLARDKAADFSDEIVKLAVDIGSFNNLPTADAMRKIQSALVGMYRPMRDVGVVLSAATVEQRALNMGLADTSDSLTAADKALAAYQMMLEGSKDAQGDFIRTSDGFANSSKILRGEVEDLQAAIGDKLLPLLSEWVGSLADVTNEFTKLIEEIEETIDKTLTEDLFKRAEKSSKKYFDFLVQEQADLIEGLEREKYAWYKTSEMTKEYEDRLEIVRNEIKRLLDVRREEVGLLKKTTEETGNLRAETDDFIFSIEKLCPTLEELGIKIKDLREETVTKEWFTGLKPAGPYLEDLNDDLEEMNGLWDQIATSAGDAFGSIMEGGMDAKKLFTELLSLMIAMSVQGPTGLFLSGMFRGILGAPSPGYTQHAITMGQIREARTLSKPMFGKRFIEENAKQNLNIESISTWSLE